MSGEEAAVDVVLELDDVDPELGMETHQIVF